MTGWLRVVVATLARGVVATLLGLALWWAAPAVIGWHPTTVMSGSMQPRLHPGDVVVSKPVAASALRPGQVLLFDDPDHAGRLRLHRFVATGEHGTLVTKGDANPQNDSTPVAATAVQGVGFLRVPYAGLPVLWAREGQWGRVLGLAALLAGVLALTTLDRSLRHPRHPGAPHAVRPASPPRVIRRRARHVHRLLRSAGSALVVVLLLVAIEALQPAAARADVFAATTVSGTSQFTASTPVAPTGLVCANDSDGTSVTISWAYSGDPAYAFELLSGSSIVARQLAPATSLQLASTGLLDLGSTYTLALRSNLIASSTSWISAPSTATVKVQVVAVLGLLNGVRCA